MTCVISFARPFDLDHFGAQVAKKLCRPWPSQHPGKIKHTDACQRRRGRNVRQERCNPYVGEARAC